jgi:CheY-like chemotaxis protein
MERRRPRTPPARPLVLIVDGHEDTRELYAITLPVFGSETLSIADEAGAFARAWQSHPDIIVTEIAFPHRHDGFHLLEDLKRDARTRDIPVVVLTSFAEKEVRDQAEREGCAAIFFKPFLPEDLAQALRELLAQKTL